MSRLIPVLLSGCCDPLASGPVFAESLDATGAQRFALGKLFAFACFDGSRGAGRVLGRRLSYWHHSAPRLGTDLFSMVAGKKNAQG